MKYNKWGFLNVAKGDFHAEFLDTFAFTCSLLPFSFFCISSAKSRSRAKHQMFVHFAMWKFTLGGGHQRLCFDLNGIEFFVPWFKELKVPAQQKAPAESPGSNETQTSIRKS